MKRQISRMLFGFGITAFILGWQFGYMDEIVGGVSGLVPDAIEEKASSAAPDADSAPDWLQRYIVNNPFLPGYDIDEDSRFSFSARTQIKRWPVLDVIDGDSLVVMDENKAEREVELAGIDAFELDQPNFGEDAYDNLLHCVEHKYDKSPDTIRMLIRDGFPEEAFEKGSKGGSVALDVTGEDARGRLIAYVYSYNRARSLRDPDKSKEVELSCSYTMVLRGAAFRTIDDPRLIEAESIAKDRWAGMHYVERRAEKEGREIKEEEKFIPPWEWRELKVKDDLP